ncbi:hypothetical protein [Parafannyhessea umbonata]|uniref:hypothetical protein n=1 Tax=Parafannyhessea umbonata TaxID=604330 RepID=UPI0026EBA1B7|nr:hypothetical protein [Parafannyhessea umbonata]
MDDDEKTVEFKRERPHTWLEELGELNEEGKLESVSRTLRFPRPREEEYESDDVAWL